MTHGQTPPGTGSRLRPRYRGVLATALALAAMPAALAAQDLPTVAVADFGGIFASDGPPIELGPTVTDMLITEFAQMGGLEVLERAELKALLDEQDLQLSGRTGDVGVVEIGKLLGVQYVFFGQVSSIAGTLRMDIRAVDVETSETLTVLSRLGSPTTALFTEIVSFADDFAGMLDLVPPSDRPAVEEIPVPAVIAYSRGLDLEDRGDVDAAITQYEAALALYGGYRAARRSLERLREGR